MAVDLDAAASPLYSAPLKRRRMDTRGEGEDDRGGMVAFLRHCSTAVSYSSSSSSRSPVNLPDSPLEEIFLRLPTAKSAVRFKVLSKHWHSVISNPDFPDRFVNAHVNDWWSSSETYHHQCCKILCNFRSRDENVENSVLMIAPFTDPSSNSKEEHHHGWFSLACLPEEPSRVSVLASCNDLLLCLAPHQTPAGNYDYDNYYICNPFTREWTLLSSHRANKRHFEKGIDFGILCDPDNSKCPSTAAVVCVAQTEKDRLLVKKYCPDTSKWSESECLVGEQFQLFSNIVAYRGKFHWFNGNDKIVAYDPFNNGATAFISCTQLKSAACLSTTYCLGVCRGSLRAMQLLRNYNDDVDVESYALRIWELEDYEQGKWVLEHSARFRDMVAETPWVQELPNQSFLHPRLLAFHPILKHIVYLCMNKHILSYNEHMKELSPVGEVPPNGRLFNCHLTFPLVLPLWPSPVPVFHNDRNGHL